MQYSKNIQTDEAVRLLTENAFPGQTATEISEVTTGMCNAIYVVTLEDGRRVVLKISSPGDVGKMSNEKYLMRTEVEAMRIARANGIPAPEVLFHDDTKTLCTGEYFFMSFAEGEVMRGYLRGKPEEARTEMNVQIGRMIRAITSVSGEGFGIVAADKRYDNFFDFVYALCENPLLDARRLNVNLGLDPARALALLTADRAVFGEVTTPAFVHFDIWENNLMVKDGEISSVLDWERALWGDPLMEERFRVYARRDAICQGYGRASATDFTPNEQRRMLWYDFELLATMTCEGTCRGYADNGLHDWAFGLLAETWKKLTE